MRSVGICGVAIMLGGWLAASSCGPSAPDDGTGSGAASSSGRPAEATGPTASGPSDPDGTSSSGAASTSPGTTGSDSGTTGAPVGCADDPPAMVPEPPPGCEHLYLAGPGGVADLDLTRPAGYWQCGGVEGYTEKIAAVACNCEIVHPPCRDGSDAACGSDGRACEPGASCVDFYGNGFCGCLAQCTQDADCGPGEVCACASAVPGSVMLTDTNRCVPADCITSGDCSGARECRMSREGCGWIEGLYCTTIADDCGSEQDCAPSWCRYDEVEELWTCEPGAICE